MAPKTLNSSAPHQSSGIVIDHDTMAAKSTIMDRWKINAKLNSVSKVSAFIAGPLFAWGVIEAIKYSAPSISAFFGGTAATTAATATTAAATGTTVAAATAFTLPVVLSILAVGAVFAAVAITTDYMATRKGQSTYFDNQEAISQSTARNLVREMEAHKLCITNAPEYEGNARADNKTWVAATAERQAQHTNR